MSTEMEVLSLRIPEVKLIKTRPYADHRGSFVELFRQCDEFPETFVQSNLSISEPNVLRGLHTSVGKFAQGKLITVLKGSILDVAIDWLNQKTPRYIWYRLDPTSGSLYVPPGFLHGFLAGPDGATVVYSCTTVFSESDSFGVRWDDPDLGIDWQLNGVTPILSEKDANAPSMTEFHAKLCERLNHKQFEIDQF